MLAFFQVLLLFVWAYCILTQRKTPLMIVSIVMLLVAIIHFTLGIQ